MDVDGGVETEQFAYAGSALTLLQDAEGGEQLQLEKAEAAGESNGAHETIGAQVPCSPVGDAGRKPSAAEVARPLRVQRSWSLRPDVSSHGSGPPEDPMAAPGLEVQLEAMQVGVLASMQAQTEALFAQYQAQVDEVIRA